ncbi:response regulator [uncultured Sneathiella sp.]|uniref:response regulator n=1 Tax=uncultured Sneathiella sp. TaxID=879315 RepID=UPI0030ED1535|tara:strand:- start:38224 stop:39216 length:993 start_codon:yes stop_codon:yes gene_type:complete
MADTQFQAVKVLLFDPDPAMRHNTRSALLNTGFGEVVACAHLVEFEDKAQTGEFDLILAETGIADADTHQIIHEIRRHKIGRDPFVNVVLSLWNSAPEVVDRVMKSGADDLITRPMSRSQIVSRIQRLVATRKPFVVTADYIGPDRRLVARTPSAMPAIIVPNSLKAKAENRPELSATPEAIQLAMKVVNERKISIYTEQLMRLSSAVVLLFGTTGSARDRRAIVAAMQDRNGGLATVVKGTKFEHVTSLSDALDDLLQSIDVEGHALSDKDRELLSQIPYAIHKACMEVHHTASLAFDIRDVSSQLRNKQTRQNMGTPSENEVNIPVFD